jgi:methylated-DNA-[protein]-cysteine S-methyltransferase
MSRRTEHFTTPFGVGALVLDGDLPRALSLPDLRRVRPGADSDDPWCERLRRYFDGEPESLDLDLDRYLACVRMTAFEADVVRALAGVPYGETASYRDLAVAAGHPQAQRAVGSVMARNELPVILPCHRIVRSDGSLGRYGDDPAWKHRLLELEGAAIVCTPGVC